jgi:preprotein translocase subunit SecD
MTRSNKITLLIIIALFAFTAWIVFPFNGSRLGRNGMREGLDLVGGVNLVYQGVFSDNVSAADQSAAMDREILTIQKRIDAFGVTEPIIQKLGNNRIQIQLPGFTDVQTAKSLVEQTGFLEFRVAEKNASGTVVTLGDYLNQDKNYKFI